MRRSRAGAPPRPDVRFIVIGEGPEEEALRGSSLGGHVEFVGPRSDAASLIGAFDLFVVPSRYEAFGLVALEAMLSGVPVVAARTGGLVEVLDGAGRLVPTEDSDAFAQALLELSSDEEARRALAAEAGDRARREFGLERMIRETRAVYSEVCAC